MLSKSIFYLTLVEQFVDNRFATKSIQHGSIIQEIVANTDKIILFAGMIYAVSNAVFSLVKKAAEIKKITVETKKLELESEKLQRELDSQKAKERTDRYIEAIQSELLQQFSI